MSVHGQRIIQWFEQFSPKSLAVEGDKIGLQIGSLEKQIDKVMISLDVTLEVVEEAIDKKVNLIIAHHPVIFRALAHLRTDLPAGKMYALLLKHDIAVYVAHTNLDITKGGVNDWLGNKLKLSNMEVLSPTFTEKMKQQDGGESIGLGRIGYLEEELSLREFANHVKECLEVPQCRVVGELDKRVRKIAVLGGDGNKYIYAAIRKGADVLVTGDMYFHTAHDALAHGLSVVDPGHHVEKVMMKGVQKVLREAAEQHKEKLDIITSNVHTEPFTFI